MKNRLPALLLILIFAAPFLSGCSPRAEKSGVIAIVNGEPVFLKDLKRELSIALRQNPSLKISDEIMDDMVDTLIKRRIIIQEATSRNMAQEQKFVDTIEAFWEQTLIRDFVEYKTGELDRYVFVTEKEVADYYDTLKGESARVPPLEEVQGKIKEVLKQRKNSEALENWLDHKKEKSEISTNKKLISAATK